MQIFLLAILGITLLIFCIVDLWHLKQMLKTMQNMLREMQKLTMITRRK